MADVEYPFIGSEALKSGKLNRHQLRTRYRAVLPNVYLPEHIEPSLELRTVAAWLWSGRRAVISGAAAAALHGAQWIPDGVPVELVHANPRAPHGVLTRRGVLGDGETQQLGGYPVTTPERTAFDIGRRGAVHSAVARLDALARATGFKIDDVLRVAENHPRSPGLRSLETALELVDAGAQSPRESYLRLLLIDAGLPRPQTQIPVVGADGMPVAYLDLGWEDRMVAVEYDGDHHRSDRRQYVKDILRMETLEQMGWTVVRVVAEDSPASVLRRVRAALAASTVQQRI
ncbi:hypothetical protein MRAB57_963 [Mycobacterium rhizamassiliense]|jgi:hypothetical protein|uniref:DUF559 domain-containing protein n=1 Tax=Mycobacterium rhizamassiliense TaxID=1841860 RepID=A0A2U3NNR7_9MYCO|nr:hypothetical protein [Mycobacterium rhizamassiliense]SPM33160.1 hypothetical protein MRAB57_963 [Mycobacterium rhizamassiliense]